MTFSEGIAMYEQRIKMLKACRNMFGDVPFNISGENPAQIELEDVDTSKAKIQGQWVANKYNGRN